MKYFLLIFAFTCLFFNAFSQKNIPVIIAGKKYTIPAFTQVSAISFTNWLTSHKIIAPIKESSADIEVRSFYTKEFPIDFYFRSSIEIFKAWKDSISFERIEFGLDDSMYYMLQNEKYVVRDERHIPLHNGSYKRYVKVESKANVDSVIKALIRLNLFSIPDYTKVITAYKLNGVIINKIERDAGHIDEAWLHVYEIKVDNYYRNFRMNFRYGSQNSNYQEFRNFAEINQLFRSLF